MVAAFLVLGFAMEFTEVGRSLFSDNRHVYLITSKSMYLAAGLIATCYAILILRHMLFSKTMPWTGSKED